jgi:hypothetical protein
VPPFTLENELSDKELPEPAVMCDCGGNYYTESQMLAAETRYSELFAAYYEACVDAAKGSARWQPIGTAPKDGTEILLAAPGRVTYGHWLKPSDVPRIVYQEGFAPEQEWEDFEPHWMSWDGGFTEENPPSHWMPLPPPPATGVPQP